jgi:alpha-aminoadipic semialdehyde synthase
MYAWERRTPLIPEHLKELATDPSLEFVVQSSEMRAFGDDEYRRQGFEVREDLADCPVIIGLKEVPIPVLEPEKVYVYFSHTIKGQPFNMPMLQRLLDLRATLIDYERIVDDHGRRLVFFGNYAGLAGMIDTLWSLGRRLAWEGIRSPFEAIRQASTYPTLDDARAAVRRVGEEIAAGGLPEEISPLWVGVTGYGNVSRGAQEILDLLPLREMSAKELLQGSPTVDPAYPIIKVVFREEDTVERLAADKGFDLQEYYKHPERYQGIFERYLPKLHLLVNCIYWEPKYPRLITRQGMRDLFATGRPRLRVIGDISCDVKGAVEVTLKATEPDDPVYVYQPETGTTVMGVEGNGPVMMAVEILPSELPREASAYFSKILQRFVPTIARADFSGRFEECRLTDELRRAVIVYRGELTPAYRYLEQHLNSV